jgi:protein tyrosine phosphatase (PTP) superfamily phosphohydrolase (DUF442 family)
MSEVIPLDQTARAREIRARSTGVSKGWFSRFFNLRPRTQRRQQLVRFPCGDGLSLGCSPTLADIEDLARRGGLRSLVNLNTEGEPSAAMSPNVEASWAHALDLRHERVSFAADLPRVGDVDRFLQVLASVPRPVFVHSQNGRRAAAMILIHLGLEQRIPGTAAVQAAKGLGVTCTLDSLRRFAESEIDRRNSARSPDRSQSSDRVVRSAL